MLTILNRQYEVIAQITTDDILEDVFFETLDTFTSSWELTLLKSEQTHVIVEGVFVIIHDIEKDKSRFFEVFKVEDVREDKALKIYTLDVGVDLYNEELGAYAADSSYPIEHYLYKFLWDSGYEIGINEIGNSVVRKLSWEGNESAVKRLLSVARRFDVELSCSINFDNDFRNFRRTINIHRRRGEDKQIRLELGVEVQSITSTRNILDLGTAIFPKGENDVTLHGFEVPQSDKQVWALYDGFLIHKPSTKLWSRHQHDIEGFIPKFYDSTAKTPKTLYDEAKLQLLKWCNPQVEYTIQITDLPKEADIGDTINVVDHTNKPPFLVSSRLQSIRRSFIDRQFGEIVISNIQTLENTINEDIQRITRTLKSQQYILQNQPHILTIQSSNGTIFQNNNISTTLTAKITKNDIDVTNTMTRIVWERVSRYTTTGDADFNREGVSISITKDDVDAEARFICKAYTNDDLIAQADIVIKDFVMTAHRGETAPENPDTGTLWVDTTNNQEITKIYDNGKWSAVVNDITADDLQNGLETYLAPIREKQQLLEAELQAKATKDLSDKMLAEFQAFVQQVNDNRKFDSEQLLSLLQRLALQETNFGKFKNQWNFLDGFITFSDEGMYIGSKESSTSILVANGGITIFSNGSEVASFKEGYMKIDNGIFTRSVQIGMKWRIQPYRLNDDVLAFIYLGGVIEVV